MVRSATRFICHFQFHPSVVEVVVGDGDGNGDGDGEFALCSRLPSFFESPISCWRVLVLQGKNDSGLAEIRI